jgi:7-cyano-7-deazaguanine reductase
MMKNDLNRAYKGVRDAINSLEDAADSDSDLQLGRKVAIPKSPAAAKLDTVPNPGNPLEYPYQVRLVCPEFTSLCPVTGQPDFATIVIDYVPWKKLIESKSLKLFLHSFRNHGAFHEAIVNLIADRLVEAMDEVMWLRVIGYFTARGGIAIQPSCERGVIPDTLEPRSMPDSASMLTEVSRTPFVAGGTIADLWEKARQHQAEGGKIGAEITVERSVTDDSVLIVYGSKMTPRCLLDIIIEGLQNAG